MNKLKIFNLVYKIKKVNIEDRGSVDHLKLASILIKKVFKTST